MLRDRSLTARQIADRLDRSLYAVEQARIAYAENVPNPGKQRVRQQWSDTDLAVALDRSLTMSEAARQLGRTVGAVRSARALYSRGRTGDRIGDGAGPKRTSRCCWMHPCLLPRSLND